MISFSNSIGTFIHHQQCMSYIGQLKRCVAWLLAGVFCSSHVLSECCQEAHGGEDSATEVSACHPRVGRIKECCGGGCGFYTHSNTASTPLLPHCGCTRWPVHYVYHRYTCSTHIVLVWLSRTHIDCPLIDTLLFLCRSLCPNYCFLCRTCYCLITPCCSLFNYSLLFTV